MNENFRRQHQSVRQENEINFGGLSNFVDYGYA